MSSGRQPNVFDALALADNKIPKQLDNAHDDHDKVLAIHAKRADLYRQVAEGIPDMIIKEIIYTKRDVILNTLGILQTQHNIQSDIAKVISRLDDLESNYKRA